MNKSRIPERVTLLPAYYEEGNERGKNYLEKGNFIRFSFFEHKEYATRYRKRDGRTKPLVALETVSCEIDFPLTANPQLMMIRVGIPNEVRSLDFFKNFLYDSIQEYQGDPNSALEALLENIQTNQKTGLMDLTIGQFTSTQLDGKSPFLTGSKFSTGVAYNPRERTLFNFSSVERRSFLLDFRFKPKNLEEVKALKRAEYLLYTSTLPSTWSPKVESEKLRKGTGKGTVFDNFSDLSFVDAQYVNHFKFPKKVRAEIFIGGKRFEKFRFLDGVMGTVSVSANAESENDSDQTFIQSGKNKIFAPQVSISLEYTESKVFTRNDIDTIFNYDHTEKLSKLISRVN